jgi:predicted DNA-binding protein (MmcQ/YjbR family)
MDIETVKQYCASKIGATSDYPFDAETLVFRVMGKIFALMSGPSRVNLKCDPAMADILRQTYPAVTPGYHMNKRHWNIELDGSVPDDEVLGYTIREQGRKLASRSSSSCRGFRPNRGNLFASVDCCCPPCRSA